MKNESNISRDQQVLSIQKAVSKLAVTFNVDATVIFEGAVKGGAATLLATGSDTREVAELLETFAQGFRDLAEDRAQH